MRDLVSVLMATYNRSSLIEQSIDSILSQTYPNVELIVINDGSTDETEQVLAKYKDKIVCRKIPNSGRAAALNVGLSIANGEFILATDDDDITLPDAVERHINAFGKHPNAGLIYSSHFLGRNQSDNRIGVKTLVAVPDCAPEALFSKLLERMIFTLQGCLVRTSCYRAIGGFNPDMRRSQDYDVLLRLTRKYRAIGISEPTVIIRVHDGPRGVAEERFDSKERAVRGWQYLTPLYRKLYGSLALEEYLPTATPEGGWNRTTEREALVRRMSVMLRKGAWEEAVADLRNVIGNFLDLGPLSPAEAAACRSAMRNPPTLIGLAANAEVRQQMRKAIANPRASNIANQFFKGAYWGIREVARSGAQIDACFLMFTISRLICEARLSGMAGRLWQN